MCRCAGKKCMFSPSLWNGAFQGAGRRATAEQPSAVQALQFDFSATNLQRLRPSVLFRLANFELVTNADQHPWNVFTLLTTDTP